MKAQDDRTDDRTQARKVSILKDRSMYRLVINGSLFALYKTAGEAMAAVEIHARPFGLRWTIYDPWGGFYARG